MYDTQITVVGNVLNPPEWRRTTNTGALVTTFKLASTARRLDRETGRWVDGNSLRVRVSCWRTLGSNVFASVTVGDPLIVTGRLFTRDWVDTEGTRRTQYELEATSVGHDLSRGRNRFERVRPRTSTSAVEDEQEQQRVGGVPTTPVPADQAPVQFDGTPYQADDWPLPEQPAADPRSEEWPAAAQPAAAAPTDPLSSFAEPEPAQGTGAVEATELAGAVSEPPAQWQSTGSGAPEVAA